MFEHRCIPFLFIDMQARRSGFLPIHPILLASLFYHGDTTSHHKYVTLRIQVHFATSHSVTMCSKERGEDYKTEGNDALLMNVFDVGRVSRFSLPIVFVDL